MEVSESHKERQKTILQAKEFSRTWDHFSFFVSPVSSEGSGNAGEDGPKELPPRSASTPNLTAMAEVEESWLAALTDSLTLTNSALGPTSASFTASKR